MVVVFDSTPCSCSASSGLYSSSDSTSKTSGMISRCEAVRSVGGAGALSMYSAASGHRGTGSLGSAGGGGRAGHWLVPACLLGDGRGVEFGVEVLWISSNSVAVLGASYSPWAGSISSSSRRGEEVGLPCREGGWRVDKSRMESPSC